MSSKKLSVLVLSLLLAPVGLSATAYGSKPSLSAELSRLSLGQTGISAVFTSIQAVEGEDLKVYIEVSDRLQVIQKIEVFAKLSGQTEKRGYSAHRLDLEQDWNEQIWMALLPARILPKAPATIEISAHLMTKRGGLILTLGEPEPFDTQVLSKARARKEQAVFSRLNRELQGDFPFVGGIGFEAKAANAARLRAILSASGSLSKRWDLGLKISVGPSFSPPLALETPSPLLLGFELSGRRGVPTKSLLGFDIFSELFTGIDLSLPGIDSHAGLRVGGSIAIAGTARLDIGIGGGVGWFKLDQESPIFGFTGGLQSILWFGDTNTSPKSR